MRDERRRNIALRKSRGIDEDESEFGEIRDERPHGRVLDAIHLARVQKTQSKQEAQHFVPIRRARARRVRVTHQHAPQLRGERLKQKAKDGAREAADADAGAAAC